MNKRDFYELEANLDKLEAGRDMDALVAHKIMGYYVDRWSPDFSEIDYWYRTEPQPWYSGSHNEQTKIVPHYSTDIAAAWQVVERLWSKHLYYFYLSYYESINWVRIVGTAPAEVWHGNAETAPLAICRAALKAVGGG